MSIYEDYADKDTEHIKQEKIRILAAIGEHPGVNKESISKMVYGKRSNYAFALIRVLEHDG
jgi:hypothetical protein